MEKVTTSVRLNKYVYSALKTISLRKSRNMSEIIEIALAKYFLSNDATKKDIQSALGENALKILAAVAQEG